MANFRLNLLRGWLEDENPPSNEEVENVLEENVSQQTPLPQNHQSGNLGLGIMTHEQPDEAYLRHFADLFEKNNLPGVDYFEVAAAFSNAQAKDPAKSAVQIMTDVIDVLRAVDKMAAPATILPTTEHYVALVEGELKRFENEIKDSTRKKKASFERLLSGLKDLTVEFSPEEQQAILLANKGVADASIDGESTKQQIRFQKMKFVSDIILVNIQKHQEILKSLIPG